MSSIPDRPAPHGPPVPPDARPKPAPAIRLSGDPARPAPRGCPVCGRPASTEQRPFCSPACRDRDLLAWADERYRLPARPDEDEEDAGDAGQG